MKSDEEIPSQKGVEIDDTDIFNILITTDNHLGYKENDRVRGNDSFVSFEECLKIATGMKDLDFVIMGGDLFHEHKPSRKTFWKCQSLLNEHVFGEQDVRFETY